MAEVAGDSVIDKLVPLIAEEAKLLSGVHKEVKSIKDELEVISAFLKEAAAAKEERMANEEQSTDSESTETHHTIYDPFIKATEEGDWRTMEEFIESHPQALSAKLFPKGGTALHYALDEELEEIAVSLVNRMSTESLEIQDEDGFTALAIGVQMNYPGQLDLLKLMLSKNSNLASIGDSETIPVVLASKKRSEDMTRFLYSITEKSILSPENATAGVRLLNNCIELKIFDIALELVQIFPEILKVVAVPHNRRADSIRPICALAKTFSTFQSVVGQKKSRDEKIIETANEEELIYDQTRAFLHLVCTEVQTFDDKTLRKAVYAAMMIEAADNGNIEFINEMLSANPNLIWARDYKGCSMFVHAVTNRQEKVFNLIYGALKDKDDLLYLRGMSLANNVLHLAAMLPPKSALDRISKSPAVQIQKELQWFKEVWRLARLRYREEKNGQGLTAREMFDKSHVKLINSGEKLMKCTAQSCTTVGALIATIMFAAAFTIPGGNNQNTGYPLFLSDVLFKIFIACDALALSSSTASILIFLEILTSSYINEDFLLYLPKKIMMGLLTLFISIATMMLTFCLAIAIMFGGQLQFILPIALLASSPVVLFLFSISSLVRQLYMSTFGPSIFNRNTKLPEKKEFKKTSNGPSNVDQIV